VFVWYPRRLKALNFDNFDNSHNSFVWPEYFIVVLCEWWIPCQASTSAQRQYTAVLKMCTLLKWLSLPYILDAMQGYPYRMRLRWRPIKLFKYNNIRLNKVLYCYIKWFFKKKTSFGNIKFNGYVQLNVMYNCTIPPCTETALDGQ